MDHFRLHPVVHRILDWVPAALSVLMIALESTTSMSAANTSRFLYPLWVHLFGTPSPAHWEQIHHLIRKTGHFVGYGLVSLAFFYSWRQTLHRMAVKHWSLWRRAPVLAVLCTIRASCLAGRVRPSMWALMSAGQLPFSWFCFSSFSGSFADAQGTAQPEVGRIS
jgi:VanZ family protein